MKKSVLFVLFVLVMGCASAPAAQESSADVEARASANLDAALDNPGATKSDIIDALADAQAAGVDDAARTERAMTRVHVMLESRLLDPGLCKARVLEVLQEAQQLGFDDIEVRAQGRVATATDSCGGDALSSDIKYHAEFFTDNDGTHDEGRTDISFNGKLKEYAPLGISAQGQDTFSMEFGDVSWIMKNEYNDGCAHEVRESDGAEEILEGDVEFTLFADGTYTGKVHKDVNVVVTRERVSTHSNCDDVKAESYLEPDVISFSFEGTTTDFNFITDANVERFNSNTRDTNSWTIIWDLHIPK